MIHSKEYLENRTKMLFQECSVGKTTIHSKEYLENRIKIFLENNSKEYFENRIKIFLEKNPHSREALEPILKKMMDDCRYQNGESLEIQTPDDNALKQQIDQKKPEYINKIMGVIDVLEGINTNLKEFIRVLELINEDVVIDVDLDLDESDFLQLIQLIISYNNIFIQKLQEIITEIETEYITKNTIIIFNNICDYMINGVLLVNCISSSRSYQEKINYLHEYIQGTNKLSCLGPDVLQKTRNNLITKYKIIENTDQQLVELSMHLYEIKNRE